MPTMLKRHDSWDIFIHWWNALLWLALFATGLGLIDNPRLNPLGGWYPDLVRGLFGGGGNLLLVHEVLGGLWAAGFIAYLLFNARGALFFLREVFRVDASRDLPWLVKKPIDMLFGCDCLKRFGLDPKIPDQGFYNMGQKAFAQLSVAGNVAIAATGLVMVLSQTTLGADRTLMVSWAVALHYLFAGLVFVGLLVHVYMAAVAREERPGFVSMFTGKVPADYARHHHRLWHDRVAGGDS